MKRYGLAWTFVAILLCATTSYVDAQEGGHFSAHFRTIPLHESSEASGDLAGATAGPAIAASASTLPMWSYRTTASRDGKTYTGKMVGRSPFFHGARATNLNVVLVPVAITIVKQKVKTLFDPSRTDAGCLPNGSATALSLTEQSPILTATNFNMNGVVEEDAQYVDAFQRANFFEEVNASGNRYHTQLNLIKIVPASLSISGASGEVIDTTSLGGCGSIGIVDINAVEKGAEKMLPSLKSKGAGPNTIAMFLFYNIVMNDGPPTNPPNGNCCTLGFHSAVGTASKPQVFLVAEYDSTGVFFHTGDTSILSHEVAETYDDPLGNNPAPSWGGTGQVEDGCQANLEAGDPLSGTLLPAVMMPNGIAYNLQELAFYSWFFGAPSIGAGNLFSDNRTFSTDAGSICR